MLILLYYFVIVFQCRSFSCRYVVNGKNDVGGGTWSEHYPQYDTANIRRPN